MEAVRRYVFPLLWMVLVGAIAAALLKLAFFSGSADTTGNDAVATASFDTAKTVAVEKGDITADLALPAKVSADAGSPVTASAAGEITKVWVEDGDRVGQGEPLVQVRTESDVPAAEPASAPSTSTGAKAADTTPTATAPRYEYRTVRASSDGTVRSLAAKRGTTVDSGATLLTVSPGTYSVIATVTPEQHLRLLGKTLDATVVVPSSPDPVSCRNARIEDDEPAAGSSPSAPDESGMPPEGDPAMSADGSTGTSAAHVRCPLPAGTKIVPGLDVEVSLNLGSANGVLTVPATAVEGAGANGVVYVPDPKGGKPVRRPVTLGLRSDESVQVSKGLTAGQKVLQYAPGVDDPEGQGGDMPPDMGGEVPPEMGGDVPADVSGEMPADAPQ